MADTISPHQRDMMNGIARALDDGLNGPAGPKRVAFCLLTANFDQIEGGRVNYISNADRADMIAMVKEWLARMEGRYAEKGGRA